ncbi:hypothetical protein AB0H97_36370 [Streptomyces sp. NPDC050788]|jgi:hypothetical protein|uniref:hypothetical protein n=1 Tax=Streptomyces sp. NPDC050788 TaxID=3155041 RepID=UPI0034152739
MIGVTIPLLSQNTCPVWTGWALSCILTGCLERVNDHPRPPFPTVGRPSPKPAARDFVAARVR